VNQSNIITLQNLTVRHRSLVILTIKVDFNEGVTAMCIYKLNASEAQAFTVPKAMDDFIVNNEI
jgi:hypothetical protein